MLNGSGSCALNRLFLFAFVSRSFSVAVWKGCLLSVCCKQCPRRESSQTIPQSLLLYHLLFNTWSARSWSLRTRGHTVTAQRSRVSELMPSFCWSTKGRWSSPQSEAWLERDHSVLGTISKPQLQLLFRDFFASNWSQQADALSLEDYSSRLWKWYFKKLWFSFYAWEGFFFLKLNCVCFVLFFLFIFTSSLRPSHWYFLIIFSPPPTPPRSTLPSLSNKLCILKKIIFYWWFKV